MMKKIAKFIKMKDVADELFEINQKAHQPNPDWTELENKAFKALKSIGIVGNDSRDWIKSVIHSPKWSKTSLKDVIENLELETKEK